MMKRPYRTVLFVAISSCSTPAPVAPSAEATRQWNPTLTISAPNPVFGTSHAIFVDINDNARRDIELAAFASPTQGAGPCDMRTRQCMQLSAPFRLIERRAVDSPDSDTIVWSPPPILQPGDTFHMQVALLRGGRLIAASNVVTSTVLPFVQGCRRPGSPDYDPQATVDAPCACPEYVSAATMADLSPFLNCTDLGTVVLDGVADHVVELPNLEHVRQLAMLGSPTTTQLRLPALTTAERLEIGGNASLAWIDAQALEVGGTLQIVGNHRLAAIDLGSPLHLDFLAISDNDTLMELEAPGLETVGGLALARNPAMVRVDLAGLTAIDDLELIDTSRLTRVDLGRATGLQLLFLGGDLLPVLSIPDLATVEHLFFDRTRGQTALDVPSLRRVGRIELEDTHGLTSLGLSGVEDVGYLRAVRNTDLQIIDLGAMTTLDSIDLLWNPSLTSLDLSSLGDTDWVVIAQQNVSLCMTAVPAFANPPPGCLVFGNGNACDP
jgi:hypothetical protein